MIRVYGLNVDAFKQSKSEPFFRKMEDEKIDIICLQETGRAAVDLPPYIRLAGYHLAENHDPVAPGRTGVAILSRHAIATENKELCEHEHCRGRFVEAMIGTLRVASVYAHAHVANDGNRWPLRRQFSECLGAYIRRNASTPCIMVMDANVALSPADIANDTQWKGPWANGSSGAYRLPIVDAMQATGWTDSYRAIHGDRRRATVWIPNNFAPKAGIEGGFGIDFQLVSGPVVSAVREAYVFKPASWAERFSDHAPTLGVYDIAVN